MDNKKPLSTYYRGRKDISATDMNRIEERLHALENITYEYPMEIIHDNHSTNVLFHKYIPNIQYGLAGEDIDPNISNQTWEIHLAYKKAVASPSDTETIDKYVDGEDNPKIIKVINPLKLSAKEGDPVIIALLERSRGYWVLLDVKSCDKLSIGFYDSITFPEVDVTGAPTEIYPGTCSDIKNLIKDDIFLEMGTTESTPSLYSNWGVLDNGIHRINKDPTNYTESIVESIVDQAIPICYRQQAGGISLSFDDTNMRLPFASDNTFVNEIPPGFEEPFHRDSVDTYKLVFDVHSWYLILLSFEMNFLTVTDITGNTTYTCYDDGGVTKVNIPKISTIDQAVANLSVALGKNGASINSRYYVRNVRYGDNFVAFSLNYYVELDIDDYISVLTSRSTPSGNVYIYSPVSYALAHLFIIPMNGGCFIGRESD